MVKNLKTSCTPVGGAESVCVNVSGRQCYLELTADELQVTGRPADMVQHHWT